VDERCWPAAPQHTLDPTAYTPCTSPGAHCATSRHGPLLGYTKAGRKLHLSQPAASIQVRQLKEDSGISWFQSPGREIDLIDSALKLSGYGRNLSGPCKPPEGGPPKANERPPSQRCELATTALGGESPGGQSPAGPPLLQGNGTPSGGSWPARSSWDNPSKPSIELSLSIQLDHNCWRPGEPPGCTSPGRSRV
jgi:hypothetical protein